MDKSAEGDEPATVTSTTGEIQQRQSNRVRRRLVQSTLVPHKSPTTESKDEQKDDKECNGEGKDGDDEECCGSQGKKKGTQKRKETPRSKTPEAPKRAKEKSSVETTPEKDATPKKSKVSSVNGAPRKRATPKKNGASNGKAAHLVENGDASPKIPNLRLEAKMMAEENSRVFAGKQVHPFFLSRNMGKRCDKTTTQRKPKSITIGPIHVFEKEQDDAVSLDWRDWKFCERSLTNNSHTLEGSFSSIFESTIKSLCFDKVSSELHLSDSSLLHDNMSLDECLSQKEFLHEVSATAVSSDVQDYRVDEVCLISGCVKNSDAEQQHKILLERMSSHLGCANQLDNRLWTDKYQPKKALEICGNDDSVKILNEWLYTWHQRGQQAGKASFVDVDLDNQDPDYNCSQNDSDLENISEEAVLKNVLLLTGPVGSGKSAAVYACAKEQGFRILEANTSDCRNGAAMKERFGALESQSTLDSQLLQRSQESLVESQSMDIIKSPAILPDGRTLPEIGSELIEVMPISDEDISHEATEASEKFADKDSSVPCIQGQLKPLILFEDVDIIFSEDRGFITAIQQIADKVKGPVILTSNREKPVLPESLDRLEVCFKLPLEEELIQHLHMVCSSEKTNVQPHLVEQLIEFCQRDIRKTIMHLQFWCQGEQFRKGNEVRTMSGLVPFNLEAGYQILPKMFPWDFPSQLAVLVENEITMSLSIMEKNSVIKEVFEDKFDDKDMQNYMEKPICETDSIEAKKKAMLSNNCPDHNCIDFIPLFDAECNFFDSSSSPLPFSPRNSRRKLIVMSSDSEDEYLNGEVPTTPDKATSNELFLEVDGGFLSHHSSMQKGSSPSTDLQLWPEAEKLEENLYQCSETAIELNVNDTCLSVDVSCVPESSFVPETEINDGTELLIGRVSCSQVGQMAEIVEEASVSNEFRQSVVPVEAHNFDESMPKLHKDSDLFGGTCDVTAVLSHEEVEDSQNGLVESITREHQLMDECSCMDFSRKFKQHEKCTSSAMIDTVRESWKKLRDHHADLKHFIAAEHKCSSGIVKLACGMSNLISHAELLHIKCQSLDSLGLPMIFSEESDAFSWYNEQLQMASTILQYGFRLYAKDIAAIGLNMGFNSRVDLAWEMLSTPSKMEVNSSFGQNINSKTLHVGLSAEMSLPEIGTTPNSGWKSIVQSIVPSRAYMTVKGDALYEYLSSLGHISRSESSHLSEGVNTTKRRRGRASRNYLSSGSLMLSPEEILSLGQSNVFGKSSFQSIDTNIRQNG